MKEFLSPVLQSKAATKVKKYGARVKSYAQALGIEKGERNTERTTPTDREKKQERETGIDRQTDGGKEMFIQRERTR